jgi:type IV pilus assembly protein PilA
VFEIPIDRQGWIMAPRRGGFTMVEMMVVVGVIAILALIAAPSFQNQIVRDQINTALPLADIVKAPIAASWAAAQSFPADNAGAGLPSADKIVNNYISSILVHDGAIHITFGNRANGQIKGKILTIRPAVVEDAPVVPVAWVCGTAEGPGKMTVKGENKTNIPTNYLPFNCRGRNPTS